MSSAFDPNLDRLAEAIEAYIEHKTTSRDGRQPGSADALLEQHDSVRDLLEPMLSGEVTSAGELPDGPNDTRLGEYRLVREIGRGGMGVVYEAEDETLGRSVALKVLPAHLTLSALQIERFRREASAIAKLEHENIVRVHAVGQHQGSHFIAMELRNGRNLRDVLGVIREQCGGDLQRLQGVDLAMEGVGYYAQVAGFVAQIADALAFSHDRGVIHRDVKPQNILVDEDGAVCLVDFGLAKDLDSASLSRTGDFAGTPEYVSPEQASAGRELVGGRSDIFSLGIVLYELLTLERPFEGETTAQRLRSIAIDEPRPVRQLNPDVPRDLETICGKALEKPLHKRYDAEGLASDLRRFLAHEPIAARPAGVLERLCRFARRRPALTVASLFAFVLFVLMPIAASVYFKIARDQLLEEQRRTAHQRDVARANLKRTLAVLDTVIARTGESQLQHLPGVSEYFRSILTDSRRLFREFLAVCDREGGMQLEAARAQGRISLIQLNLGNFRESYEVSAAAIERYRQVLPTIEDAGRRRRAALDLAMVRTNYVIAGMRAEHRGLVSHLDQAIPVYESAIAQLSEGAPTEPKPGRRSRDSLVRGLAVAKYDRAALAVGEPRDTRLALFDAAIRLWQELERKHPDDVLYAGGSAPARIERASMLYSEGRIKASQAGFQDLQRDLGKLLKRHPSFGALRDWYADAVVGLLKIEHRAGRHANVDKLAKQAGEARTWLRRTFPHSALYRDSLLAFWGMHASMLYLRREPHKMQPILARALPAAERAAGLPGATSSARTSLARILKLQAAFESWRVDLDAGAVESFYDRSLTTWLDLAEHGPDPGYAHREIAGVLHGLATWYLGRRPQVDPGKACELLDRAIEHLARARQLSPRDVTVSIYLRNQYVTLQKAGQALSDPQTVGRAVAGQRRAESMKAELLAARRKEPR